MEKIRLKYADVFGNVRADLTYAETVQLAEEVRAEIEQEEGRADDVILVKGGTVDMGAAVTGEVFARVLEAVGTTIKAERARMQLKLDLLKARVDELEAKHRA